MVKHLATQAESAYGFPQPLRELALPPVSALRAPATTDTGYSPGQFWVDGTAGTAFILVTNVGGVATWLSIGGSLTPAVASLTTGPAATSTLLAGNSWSAIGTNAQIDLTISPKGVLGTIYLDGLADVADDFTAHGNSQTIGTSDLVGDITLEGEVEIYKNLSITTLGQGIQITEGADSVMGTSTLIAGTKSIAIALIDASTRVFLSRSGLNASPVLGYLIADTSVPGTLTVTSYDATGVLAATDISQFNYLCIEGL